MADGLASRTIVGDMTKSFLVFHTPAKLTIGGDYWCSWGKGPAF